VKGATAQSPRYWLARTLFRIALHDVRLGYVETYGGVFFDDRSGDLAIGIRGETEAVSVTFERADALAVVEALSRAVAPAGYRERPT
jgi:hypothetical protein